MDSEEREWLDGCESLCSSIGINIAKIKHYFEAQVWDKPNGQVCGRNFVGNVDFTLWISDTDMYTILDIANKEYSDTICFASKQIEFQIY